MNNNGFEMSFGWIFALIVGGSILALALFAVSNFATQEQSILDTESAQQIEGLLNPLQTGLESGSRPGKITFPVETQIISRCIIDEGFGENRIRVSSKSGLEKKYSENGAENIIRNHFIFSERVLEGKEMSVFVKPFTFPYKVGDMIMIWSTEFCFVQPFQSIRDELGGLNLSQTKVVDNIVECGAEENIVCFGSGGSSLGCDMIVSGTQTSGSVLKSGKRIFYEGDLIYGAIFADPEMYECSINRIMSRAKSLAEIYSGKSDLISSKSSNSCSSALGPMLENYAQILSNVNESRDIGTARVFSQEVQKIQDPLLCSLWKGGKS